MKKTLISLAVLAASTGAFAQSSVTLYGTADAGVGKLENGKVGMMTNSMVNTSDSFLGFRGTEDLGGGLKAGFRFEQGINLRDGSTDNAPTSYHGTKTTWQRAAGVWLGGNWGTLQLGRAYAPSRNALANWDLTGGARNSVNMMTFGVVGHNAGEQNSSQFSYKTPDFGGFAAELGYVFKPDNEGHSKVDLGLTYNNGPLRAGISYNKVKSAKANYALGAQYQFGMFALAAGYHSAYNGYYFDENGPVAGSTGGNRGFSLGGKVNFGAASVLLDVVRETKSTYEVGGVSYKGKKQTNGLLEGRYAFSKRTFVYANYVRYGGGNNYGIGMRHDF